MYFASLGALCRSNGLLNFGFIAAFVMGPFFSNDLQNFNPRHAVLRVIKAGFYCLLGVMPFLMFQVN